MTEKATRRKTLAILLNAMTIEQTALNKTLTHKEKQLYNMATKHMDRFLDEMYRNQDVRVKMLAKEQADHVKKMYKEELDEFGSAVLEVVYALADNDIAKEFLEVLEEMLEKLNKIRNERNKG